MEEKREFRGYVVLPTIIACLVVAIVEFYIATLNKDVWFATTKDTGTTCLGIILINWIIWAFGLYIGWIGIPMRYLEQKIIDKMFVKFQLLGLAIYAPSLILATLVIF